MKLLLNLLAFITAGLFNCSQYKGSLEEEIRKVMADYNAIGASVVVVKENKICYHNTFGYNPDYNDTTLRNPIPDDGIFWIASVSKTFISTAIMQLVERESLDLDDDINKYLKFKVRNPNFPDVPITVRMLLWHRSSLNDKHYGWTLKMLYSGDKKIYEESFNDYKPGDKYEYCNLNYSLLGAIIENVSRMRFDEYIEKNICSPLGLNASFNLEKIDSTKLVKAYLYDKKKKRFKLDKSIYSYKYVNKEMKDYASGYSTASLSPAGGMKISAEGLAQWMMVHMNYGELNGKQIISKKSN